MLQIKNLKKTYSNGVRALNGLSLQIEKGIFGLLGPNGAGKTTLMRMIATLQEPDSGSIYFEGMNVLEQKEEIRKILGYLPQEFGVYPHVTAEEMLTYLAVLKGVVNRRSTVEQLLALTNLTLHRKKKLGGFSGGMKQRFGIAQALLGDPKILIVDEPTAGLDPSERDRFHNILSQIGEERVVILSTHIVSDVTELCNDMAIIRDGEVILHLAPEEAIRQLKGKVWKTFLNKSEAKEVPFKMIHSRPLHGKMVLKIWSETHPGLGFEAVEPDLEDVYFATMQDLYVSSLV